MEKENIIRNIQSKSENLIRNTESLTATLSRCETRNIPLPIVAILCPNWSIDNATGQRSINSIDGEDPNQKLGVLIGQEIPSLISLFNKNGLPVNLTVAVSDIFDQGWVIDANKIRNEANQNLNAVKTLWNRFGMRFRDLDQENTGSIVLHSELMKKMDGFKLLEQLQLEALIDGTPSSELFQWFKTFFMKMGEYETLLPKGDLSKTGGKDLERMRKNFNKWLNRVLYLSAQYSIDGLFAEEFAGTDIPPVMLNVIKTKHGDAVEFGWNFLRNRLGKPLLPIIELKNNGIEHSWSETPNNPIIFDEQI